MRPDGLNALSVGHPDIIHVGEIVICLTRCTVANDMELGDRYAEQVDTGDKGPNTHWVHGENIEITVNI